MTKLTDIINISGWPVGTQREIVDLGATGGTIIDSAVEDELRRVLAGMRYGSVTLIVQDGRIVQIDATHKVRIQSPRPSSRSSNRQR